MRGRPHSGVARSDLRPVPVETRFPCLGGCRVAASRKLSLTERAQGCAVYFSTRNALSRLLKTESPDG
ncbi:hypothetical protein BREVUG8_100486 [Brevundimonas sp. G8]|nr:hypothetical protein BREVUG8_100486 [Brevundimonas sp. G8]